MYSFCVLSPSVIVVLCSQKVKHSYIIIPTNHEQPNIRTCLVISDNVLHVAESAVFTGTALVIAASSLPKDMIKDNDEDEDFSEDTFSLYKVDETFIVVKSGTIKPYMKMESEFWKSQGLSSLEENLAFFKDRYCVEMSDSKLFEMFGHYSVFVISNSDFFKGSLDFECKAKEESGCTMIVSW